MVKNDNRENTQKQHTVLIVDDDLTTCTLLKTILEINNFICTVVHNGKDAISTLEHNHFDCILLDILMPILNGFDTCRHILSDSSLKSIPIIIITAKNDENTLMQCFDLGIYDYIEKPFSNNELVSRVKAAIRKKDELNSILDTSKKLEEFQNSLKEENISYKKEREKLLAIERLKDNFIATTTHKLKTPIATIKTMASLLMERQYASENEIQDFSKYIYDQTEMLTRIIDDLLSSFKLITESYSLSKSPISIEEMCNDVAEPYRFLAKKQNIDFQYIRETEEKYLYCDHEKIKELLDNLLSNAFKFTDKGHIIFRVYTQDNFIHFSVEDTGTGIPENERASIFKKYFRSKKHSNREGSGIGLYLAREIAHSHGGDIFVKSNENSGTKFVFFIPATQIPDYMLEYFDSQNKEQ